MASFDPKRVNTLDWVVIGAGGLAFIASFFNWYSASVSFGGLKQSHGVSAWSAGFAAWFSVLLLVVAAGLVLAAAAGQAVKISVPLPVLTLGLSVLALVLIVLRWLTFPSAKDELGSLGSGLDASSGAGVGLYIGLVCALAAAVASFMMFRASGGNFNQIRRTPGAPPPPSY
jgi:hypothetical protein